MKVCNVYLLIIREQFKERRERKVAGGYGRGEG